MITVCLYGGLRVSTHSRLKAAGKRQPQALAAHKVSTHSRLKAAGVVRAILLKALL